MSESFRIGDWVEVRPLREVLDTLDENGCVEGLPFMPEMVKYCGRRYRVVKSAHKTCDPTGRTNMRKMANAVYLDTRCDGSGHDGCEARCLLFWKTAWLKPVEGAADVKPSSSPSLDEAAIAHLRAATRYQTAEGLRYRCQGTEIVRATQVLSARDWRQYVEDISSGNVAVSSFLWHLLTALAKASLAKLTKPFTPASPPSPAPPPAAAKSNPALNPGDLVKVRSPKEIMPTLHSRRGPAFEAEMLRHCGRTYRILYRVNRIIDEQSGRMLKLARDCVVLDGITCGGLDNCSRLFCPRSCYYFWREAWLERAEKAPAELAPIEPGSAPSQAVKEPDQVVPS